MVVHIVLVLIHVRMRFIYFFILYSCRCDRGSVTVGYRTHQWGQVFDKGLACAVLSSNQWKIRKSCSDGITPAGWKATSPTRGWKLLNVLFYLFCFIRFEARVSEICSPFNVLWNFPCTGKSQLCRAMCSCASVCVHAHVHAAQIWAYCNTVRAKCVFIASELYIKV